MNLNKKLLFLVVYTFHKKDLQKTTFGGLTGPKARCSWKGL
jgi:hypothetical protein